MLKSLTDVDKISLYSGARPFSFARMETLSPALTLCPTHQRPLLVIQPGTGVCPHEDCDYRIEIKAEPQENGDIRITLFSSMSFFTKPSDDYDTNY